MAFEIDIHVWGTRVYHLGSVHGRCVAQSSPRSDASQDSSCSEKRKGEEEGLQARLWDGNPTRCAVVPHELGLCRDTVR